MELKIKFNEQNKSDRFYFDLTEVDPSILYLFYLVFQRTTDLFTFSRTERERYTFKQCAI